MEFDQFISNWRSRLKKAPSILQDLSVKWRSPEGESKAKTNRVKRYKMFRRYSIQIQLMLTDLFRLDLNFKLLLKVKISWAEIKFSHPHRILSIASTTPRLLEWRVIRRTHSAQFLSIALLHCYKTSFKDKILSMQTTKPSISLRTDDTVRQISPTHNMNVFRWNWQSYWTKLFANPRGS